MRRLALPHDEDPEAQGTKLLYLAGVSGAIGRKLRLPEARIPPRCGCQSAAGMMVPETSIGEYRPTIAFVRQIRRPWKRFYVEPITKTRTAGDLGNDELGSSTSLPNVTHQLASLRIRPQPGSRHRQLFGRNQCGSRCEGRTRSQTRTHRLQMRPNGRKKSWRKAERGCLGS